MPPALLYYTDTMTLLYDCKEGIQCYDCAPTTYRQDIMCGGGR